MVFIVCGDKGIPPPSLPPSIAFDCHSNATTRPNLLNRLESSCIEHYLFKSDHTHGQKYVLSLELHLAFSSLKGAVLHFSYNWITYILLLLLFLLFLLYSLSKVIYQSPSKRFLYLI